MPCLWGKRDPRATGCPGEHFKVLTLQDIVAWQVPVHLLTHSLGFFFFGLLVFLVGPLTVGGWRPGFKVCFRY